MQRYCGLSATRPPGKTPEMLVVKCHFLVTLEDPLRLNELSGASLFHSQRPAPSPGSESTWKGNGVSASATLRGEPQESRLPPTPQDSLGDWKVKNLPAMQKNWVQSLGWEDPLKKGLATHPIILAWRIPWTEEPAGLQSTVLQRVGQD